MENDDAHSKATSGNNDGAHQRETELLHRYVQRRDERAFAELIERHASLVRGVCRRVLRNHHDAEDAAQTTFLALARHAAQLRRHGALAGWLRKVAYHVSLKQKTAAARRQGAEQARRPAQAILPSDAIQRSELNALLREEIARLPEAFRAPIALCCLAELPRKEAATQLGWTVGKLKMRLERGRRLLRLRLTLRGFPLPRACAGLAWLAS